MNEEAIALARKQLDLPDYMSDEEVAAGLKGSYTEARIEFRLAWRDLVQAVKAFFVRP